MPSTAVWAAPASVSSQQARQQRQRDLPDVHIAPVCHFLHLRELVLFAATSSRHRRLINTNTHSQSQSTSSRAAAVDCWLFVPCVRLRWGVGLSNSLRVSYDSSGNIEEDVRLPSLQLNGTVMPAMTADIVRDIISTPPPAQQLLPSLAAFLRSIRHVKRFQLEQWEPNRQPSFGLLFTVLAVLPSFPCLQQLTLDVPGPNATQMWRLSSVEESQAARTAMYAVNDALFGCLRRLRALTSLELTGSVGVCGELRLIHDVLSLLFADRLLHASLPAQVMSWWLWGVRNQAAAQRHREGSMGSLQQQTNAAALQTADLRLSSFAPALGYDTEDSSQQWPEFRSLQSLHVQAGDQLAVEDVLRTFSSLLVLHMPVGHISGDRAPPAGSCALRFLSTHANLGGLPELAYLSRWSFLHSLHFSANIHSVAGAAGLLPLAALGSLTQLHELSLQLTPELRRMRWDPLFLQPHEHLDLSWANSMTSLRYLHINAQGYTTVRTLQALGLLPANTVAAESAGVLPPPSLPRFIGWVEEFGLDIHEHWVDPSQCAPELSFDLWSSLRRCSARFVSAGGGEFIKDQYQLTEHISQRCQVANMVLREKIGAERWVTAKELLLGRFDQRWRTQSD